MYVSSPIRTRVSVDQICRDCELEILGILLNVDLRVINMSEFDVILGMDWLIALIVIVRELPPTHLTVPGLRFRGISTMLYPKPCTTLDGTGTGS